MKMRKYFSAHKLEVSSTNQSHVGCEVYAKSTGNEAYNSKLDSRVRD